MPWKPKDAGNHTKKANTAKKKRQWADVADSMLARGASDASAIRGANSVVKKHPARGHRNVRNAKTHERKLRSS